MAKYKSRFKGSQIDNAVSVANANLNKGSAETPIYYDSEGLGQAVQKDSTATVSSVKPLTSGGAYTGLNAVVDNSDIQYENFNGEFTIVGNPTIVDGVASGLGNNNYINTKVIIGQKSFKVTGKAIYSGTISGQRIFQLGLGTYQKMSVYVQNNTNLQMGFTTSDGTTTTKVISNMSGNVLFEFEFTGTKYILRASNDNGQTWSSNEFTSSLYIQNVTSLELLIGTNFTNGSIDLNQFSISVDGKVVYTPYPNPALPPSQNAVKQYVDNSLPAKQDILYGGYGIDVNGATVSVSDDVFREDEEARLHADLKVDHFGDMSVGTDSEVLELMNEARHSTYVGDQPSNASPLDPKKFIKVGSPNITDGILDGATCDGSNYVSVANIDLPSATSFTLETPYLTVPSDNNERWIIRYVTSNSDFFGFAFRGKKIRLNVNNSTLDTTRTYAAASLVKFKFVYDGTSWTIYSKRQNEDTDWESQGTSSELTKPATVSPMSICNFGNSSFRYLGNFDLKDFSINLNGVPVFSGNKTGIDTIKPDDYTVNTLLYYWSYNDGSETHIIYADGLSSVQPAQNLYNANGSKYTGSDWTIVSGLPQYNGNAATHTGANILLTVPNLDATVKVTDDGVASDFKNNSGIYYDFNSITPPANWSYKVKFKAPTLPNTTGHVETIASIGLANNVQAMARFDNNRSNLTLGIRSTDGVYSNVFSDVLIAGEMYTVEFITVNNICSVYFDGVLKNSAAQDTNVVFKFFMIGGGTGTGYNPGYLLPSGSIDLNSVEFKINDTIVWQPCLKIPYTQTKDGKKIVDYNYRSRVKDEHTQAGYTLYYTLNTENRGNYTVVGSPTISSDFVASGFSSGDNGNHVVSGSFDTIKPFKIILKDIKVTTSGNQVVFRLNGSSGALIFFFNPSGKFTYYDGSNYAGDVGVPSNLTIPINIELISNTTDLTVNLYQNGQKFATKTNTIASFTNFVAGISSTVWLGAHTFLDAYSDSIDLKEFKIYVNNKLTYEAVIPPNYTMATVEEDDIVASLDGATSYTQRADLSIEQQGTTTSGTTVTFPKAFIDTNYALSLPYSAKTKTSFTAAADGDYIAEGNVSI